MAGKREEYLSWEEYYMGIALLASMRSKDPNNQVGACIVDEDEHQILSIGYNGLTRGMCDDLFDWFSTGEATNDKKHIKDYYIVHAERNAILNFSGEKKNLLGKTLYVTWSPCTECIKEIIQAGISKIVYLRKYSKKELIEIGNIMLESADVVLVPYNEEREISKEEFKKTATDIQQKIKKLGEWK